VLLKGKAFLAGDYIDTDRIYPSAYLVLFDPETMALHAMEGVDPEFHRKIEGGGIIVAGRSFGTGSAREQAAACLKHAGVRCVVAQSFARSFFRNAINVGLPVLVVPDVAGFARDQDLVEVDLDRATVRNLATGEERSGSLLPALCRDILAVGGAVPYFASRLPGGG